MAEHINYDDPRMRRGRGRNSEAARKSDEAEANITSAVRDFLIRNQPSQAVRGYCRGESAPTLGSRVAPWI